MRATPPPASARWGRLAAGPPRIAALFRDLDPTRSRNGVYVTSTADRLVVTWLAVPEYVDAGTGAPQTFQVRLYPDGRIEIVYSSISTSAAVVGISPGGLKGTSSVVTFTDGGQQTYSGTVAERFGSSNELDLVTAAQHFYATHEDSYDYLVIFNNLGIPDGPSSLASERTVRSMGTGFGDEQVDVGAEFGSPARLHAVVNMGPALAISHRPVRPGAGPGGFSRQFDHDSDP